MAFFEVEFPTTISLKAMGGPQWSTTVNAGISGQEQRNRNWSQDRGRWSVGLLTPAGTSDRQAFIDALLAFFDAVAGKADGFRLKDHKAYKATSQALITDGATVRTAIARSIGGRTYTKPIWKPIAGTNPATDYLGATLANTVFLAGTGTAVTCDATTGAVTGHAAGTLVDFEYHFPVRFDMDEMKIQLEDVAAGQGQGIISWSAIELVEVLPPNF